VAAVICTSDGFKLIEVNEAFKAMTGYAEEEVVGRSAINLRLLSDKVAQQWFEQAIRNTGGVRNIDLQLRTKDDTLVECLVSADTVTINDKLCVLCVIQDITERKRSEDELITAIESVMADNSWFSRKIVEKLAALRQTSRPHAIGADFEDLTDRQREVLGLICQGRSDKEMSQILKLSPNTIRNHVSSLYRKIDVKRRGAAIVWARERGITGKAAIKARKQQQN
jgi:PAS domain S-box-containing protein